MARRSSSDAIDLPDTQRVPEAFLQLLQNLQADNNLSARGMSLKAGLNYDAIYRVQHGHRPTITTCILLANCFHHNPNEYLELAGWSRLEIFDLSPELPPDVADLADDLARIQPEAVRRDVVRAIRTLLR